MLQISQKDRRQIALDLIKIPSFHIFLFAIEFENERYLTNAVLLLLFARITKRMVNSVELPSI